MVFRTNNTIPLLQNYRTFKSRTEDTFVHEKIQAGKYGHTKKEKHMEVHEYNPLVEPKLFTELINGDESKDPLDNAIDQLRQLDLAILDTQKTNKRDGSLKIAQLNSSVAAPMPEG